jgi:hypothetical protein
VERRTWLLCEIGVVLGEQAVDLAKRHGWRLPQHSIEQSTNANHCRYRRSS